MSRPVEYSRLREFADADGVCLVLDRVREPGQLPRYRVLLVFEDSEPVMLFDSEGRARAEDVWWQQRTALRL
jgi:hypothetical protein